MALQAYRPPDQRTVYDGWIADGQAARAQEARMKQLWATPPKQEWTAGGPQARLERESREAWEAGERRMRERREAREAAERAREAERRALDRLYSAAEAGDADALMTLGKRNEDSFSRWGIREYQRVRGPLRREALWRIITLIREHGDDARGFGEFRSVDSFLKELADSGDAKAAGELAQFELKWEDFYLAGNYFAQAGAMGDVAARKEAIRLVAEDRTDAVTVAPEVFYGWAREFAGKGEVASQWVYGRALALGGEIEKKPEEAVRLLRGVAALAPEKLSEAERGMQVRAAVLAGTMLLDGRGVVAEPEAGVALLQVAAAAGDVDAMVMLGRSCLLGKGVGANTEQGIGWLEKAADKDSAQAAELLASIYLQDDAAEYDEARGLEWLAKAAKRTPKAMIAYGRVLAAGVYGVARDQEEALQFFSMAIQRYPNDPDVLEFIGQSYVGGEYGLREKPVEGVRILKLAFERGSVGAAQRLASIYNNGVAGVAVDAAEAKAWGARAAGL
ncbi:hypothetical protein CMV30_05600 [Nibricoccus aquaticus]|uniref:Sel1 repeat family protein n=1 Tax=Nibricoccus aquaticus TaxID=2576891 RepID=A0A290Q8G9_9BACT|nr:hypothetical protein CMV30_05600 [Nibricoccus aquaticus]